MKRKTLSTVFRKKTLSSVRVTINKKRLYPDSCSADAADIFDKRGVGLAHAFDILDSDPDL